MLQSFKLGEADDRVIHYREHADYLRRIVDRMPNRPDRERLLTLADQYEDRARAIDRRGR